MHAILDMSNFREIIDHDKELERELVMNFHSCYATCIIDMGNGLANNNNVQWRNAAHALKGVAFNLGAQQLGALSLQAELACEEPLTQKTQLLSQIKAAYCHVQQALAHIN